MRWHFHLIGDLLESEKVSSTIAAKTQQQQKTVNSNRTANNTKSLSIRISYRIVKYMYSMQF